MSTHVRADRAMKCIKMCVRQCVARALVLHAFFPRCVRARVVRIRNALTPIKN